MLCSGAELETMRRPWRRTENDEKLLLGNLSQSSTDLHNLLKIKVVVWTGGAFCAREHAATKRTTLGSIFEESPLFFKLRLLGSDGPDQDPEDGFSNHVRNRVPDLLTSCRRHTGDPEHLDDVHEGIGQPGDDRKPASIARQGSDRRLLNSSCLTQSDSQLLHNVGERNHGEGPPHPPAAQAVLDLAWVAQSHHEGRGNSQGPAFGYSLLSWQSHNENQLNQEERDGENPVHIAIGIIERRTGESHRIVSCLGVKLHVKGIIPGVEDSEVVVRRNEGHQASDRKRGAILLVDVIDLQPKEDRRASHARNAEGQRIVHR